MVDRKRQHELIEELSRICNELDWVIGLPNEDEEVPGLIIGTEQFVTVVIESYYGIENSEYISFSEDPTGETSLMESEVDFTKKPKTYH